MRASASSSPTSASISTTSRSNLAASVGVIPRLLEHREQHALARERACAARARPRRAAPAAGASALSMRAAMSLNAFASSGYLARRAARHRDPSFELARTKVFHRPGELPERPGDPPREQSGDRPQHATRSEQHEQPHPRPVRYRAVDRAKQHRGARERREDREAERDEQLALEALRPPPKAAIGEPRRGVGPVVAPVIHSSLTST